MPEDFEDIREQAIEDTKEELMEGKRDRLMIKAVNFLDENNADFKEEMERFRDWYSLHFPELVKEISDDEHLVKILSNGLHRDELDAFSSMAEESTGVPLTGKDEKMLQKAFDNLEDKLELKNELEEYIEEAAKEEMPNLETLLGPLLAARLVSLAGGLEEIAKKPSSTIQVLGAEKALFRYLRGQGTPPKHGILFEHKFVNNLPEDERGKMARFLANKTAMAARLDQYGDKNKGSDLREECREKFEELKN